MIATYKINNTIRRILFPVLRENGFTSVHIRNNVSWHHDCVWVLSIKPVGSNFSDVTGWSPISLSARLGIYYPFVPPMDDRVRNEKLPKCEDCQLQLDLHCAIDQSNQIRHVDPLENKRTDIWWVEPSGCNVNEVVTDITYSFLNQGIPWLKKFTNVETAFEKLENEFDSCHKFHTAKYFAKYLNDQKKYEKYHRLFEREAEKFGEL